MHWKTYQNKTLAVSYSKMIPEIVTEGLLI